MHVKCSIFTSFLGLFRYRSPTSFIRTKCLISMTVVSVGEMSRSMFFRFLNISCCRFTIPLNDVGIIISSFHVLDDSIDSLLLYVFMVYWGVVSLYCSAFLALGAPYCFHLRFCHHVRLLDLNIQIRLCSTCRIHWGTRYSFVLLRICKTSLFCQWAFCE